MSQPKTLTLARAKALLAEAVEDYGADWVDPNSFPLSGDKSSTCENTFIFEGRTCHCLIGWVLAKHGYDTSSVYGSIEVTMSVLSMGRPAALGSVMERNAYLLLAAAQNSQDDGIAWGTAVEVALEAILSSDPT